MRGKDTFCFKKKRKPESFAPLANSRNLHSYHEEMKFLKSEFETHGSTPDIK